MDLKTDYEKLYQHWLKEFQRADLTPLSQEVYNEYKRNLNFIKNFEEDQKDKIKSKLIKAYQKNFKFLFNDFLNSIIAKSN